MTTTRKPRKRGGQPANANARKHGNYAAPAATATAADAAPRIPSIDDLIQQLQAKQSKIETYINNLDSDAGENTLAAISLFRQNSATLGRLLKTRQELGGADQNVTAALNAALDQVAADLGVKL